VPDNTKTFDGIVFYKRRTKRADSTKKIVYIYRMLINQEKCRNNASIFEVETIKSKQDSALIG
jgi:hypothetical protein